MLLAPMFWSQDIATGASLSESDLGALEPYYGRLQLLSRLRAILWRQFASARTQLLVITHICAQRAMTTAVQRCP